MAIQFPIQFPRQIETFFLAQRTFLSLYCLLVDEAVFKKTCMNILAFFNIPEQLVAIGILAAGLLVMILVWMIHPLTVGEFKRRSQSPMKQFFVRVRRAGVAALLTVICGFGLLEEKGAHSTGSSSSAPAAETARSSSASDDQLTETKPIAPVVAKPSVPLVSQVQQPAPVPPIAPPESPKTVRKKVNANPFRKF